VVFHVKDAIVAEGARLELLGGVEGGFAEDNKLVRWRHTARRYNDGRESRALFVRVFVDSASKQEEDGRWIGKVVGWKVVD
jgi:hypothetical protein